MSVDRYRTVAARAEGVLREKASKFIGIVVPIQNEDDFKIELQRIVEPYLFEEDGKPASAGKEAAAGD